MRDHIAVKERESQHLEAQVIAIRGERDQNAVEALKQDSFLREEIEASRAVGDSLYVCHAM